MAWRVPKETVAILKDNYHRLSVEELSELTGLNRSTITSIASREGFSLMPRGQNTPDAVKDRAVAFVTANHKSMSNSLLSYHTGVSIMVIKHIKHDLGLKQLSLDDWREEMESVVEPGRTPKVCMALFQQKYPKEFRSILDHFTDNAVYCKFKRLCKNLKADDDKSDKNCNVQYRRIDEAASMVKGLSLATDFVTPLDIGETALIGDRLVSIHPDWQGKNGMLCCISLWPEQDPNSEGFYEYGSVYAITSPDVLGPDTVQRFLDAAPRFDDLITRDSLTFDLQNSGDVVALVDLNRPASDVPVGIMGLQHFDWSEKRVVSLGINLNTIYIMPQFRGMGLGPMLAASVGNVMANKSEAWLCKNIGKFDNMYIEVVYEGIARGSVKCAEVFMDHLWSSLSPDAIDVHCILAGLRKRPTCNMELVNEY